MKIESLHLKNFLCHRDSQLDLSTPITIVVGPNGAGKTSIADAIEMLFLGHCRSTDKRGAGSAQLVTLGEKKFQITGVIDGRSVTRSFTISERGAAGNLKVEGWNGSSSLLQEKFLKEMAGGVCDDTLTSIIRASKFVSMSHDERRAVLFGLQGIELNQDLVMSSLDKWLSSNLDGTRQEEVIGLLKRHVEAQEYTGGPEIFPQLRKVCEEMRRGLNRDVANQRPLVESIVIPRLETKATVENLPEMRKMLAELEKERDELLQKQGAAGQLATQKSELKARLKAIQEETAKIERKLKEEAPDLEILKHDRDRLLQQSDEMQQEAGKFAEEYTDLQRQLAMLHGSLEYHTEQLNRIDNLKPGVCPLIDKLECPHPKSAITRAKKETKAIVKEKEQDIRKLEKRAESVRDKIEDRKVHVRMLSTQLEDATAKLRAAESVWQERNQYAERKAALEKEGYEVSQELKKAIFAEEDKEIEEKVRKLEERIAKGRQLIRDIEGLAETKERKAREQDKLDQYEWEAEAWNALVHAFSPRGIPADILGDKLKPIEQRANDRLARLTDGRYQFSFRTIDEDSKGNSVDVFDVLVKSPKLGWRRIENCADSEIARVGVVLTDALNSQVGLGLLVFDNAERLTARNKALLIEICIWLVQNEGYQNILILSAIDETEPVRAYPSELVTTYRLMIDEGGELSGVERVR